MHSGLAKLISSLVASGCLFSAVAQEEEQERRHMERRLWLGGRITIAGNAQVLPGKFTGTSTQPAGSLESEVKWTSGRFGAGPSLELRLLDRISLGLDLLHRGTAYRQEATIKRTGGGEDVRITEKTRAGSWEGSAIARFGVGYQRWGGFRYFAGAGVAVRTLSGIRTTTERQGLGDANCCDETPVRPAHRNALGFVASAGLRLRDDVGIKIIPEVRYTHWRDRSFDTFPVRSNPNQIEVVIGIVF
jgi:opacity protein-like surface antigen